MKVFQKRNDKPFIILNLSDTQLEDFEIGDDHIQYRRLAYTVTQLIAQTKPDLITFTGDISYGDNFAAYRKLINLFDSFDIPWAPVLGNHDYEAEPDAIRVVCDIFCQMKNCIFEYGDPVLGIGNYTVGIEENGRIIHSLFLMDSHDHATFCAKDGEIRECYGELLPQQMEWYSQMVDNLRKIGCTESTILTHVPLYVYREACAKALKEGIDAKSVPVQKEMQQDCWNEGYEDSLGVWYKGRISSCEYDGGQFDRILEKDHTRTVLVGHDHLNNAVVKYRGVTLAYTLKTGSGCSWDPRLNGGTVVKIASDGSAQLEHVYIKPPEFD